MRDRMERFVLLPFSTGCISETSIAVGPQQAKRTRPDINSTPTGIHQGEKETEENEYDDDSESLSAENLKSPLSLAALPGVQKLFKNFKNLSQLFVYKDDFEETEMGMEIGFPTDVKHVTHIGVDGCASSILSRGWNNPNQAEAEPMNLPSFPRTPLELADKPTVRSLLETK